MALGPISWPAGTGCLVLTVVGGQPGHLTAPRKEGLGSFSVMLGPETELGLGRGGGEALLFLPDHFCLGLFIQTASHLPHMHRLREKAILWSLFLAALLIARENENQKIN